jgi:hypothetical protein
MNKVAITIEIDPRRLGQCSDETLATYWHVAQANPAPHGDEVAGEAVEQIGREIIGRWLREVPPTLWHHQGRDYYWKWLRTVAKYEPGSSDVHSPAWHEGQRVPRTDAEDGAGGDRG